MRAASLAAPMPCNPSSVGCSRVSMIADIIVAMVVLEHDWYRRCSGMTYGWRCNLCSSVSKSALVSAPQAKTLTLGGIRVETIVMSN